MRDNVEPWLRTGDGTQNVVLNGEFGCLPFSFPLLSVSLSVLVFARGSATNSSIKGDFQFIKHLLKQNTKLTNRNAMSSTVLLTLISVRLTL